MASVTNITLNQTAALGGDRPVILAGIREDIEFKDKKPTGKVLGNRYDVVCPSRQFEKVTVKVANAPAVMRQEEIDARNASARYVFVTFEGFEGRIYQDYKTKENHIICTAAKVVVVPDKGV